MILSPASWRPTILPGWQEQKNRKIVFEEEEEEEEEGDDP